MTTKGANGWLWLPLTVAMIAIDQVTKFYVVQHFKLYERFHVLPVLDITLDSGSETVDYQLNQLLPSSSYYRFQTSLQHGSEQMDETGADHIRGLRLLGEKMVRDNASQLHTLAGKLVR